MSVVFGYARVSSTDQDLNIQREASQRADCTTIREEKRSDTSRSWKPGDMMRVKVHDVDNT